MKMKTINDDDFYDVFHKNNIDTTNINDMCEYLYRNEVRYNKEDIRNIFGKTIEAEVYHNFKKLNRTVKLNTKKFLDYKRDDMYFVFSEKYFFYYSLDYEISSYFIQHSHTYNSLFHTVKVIFPIKYIRMKKLDRLKLI